MGKQIVSQMPPMPLGGAPPDMGGGMPLPPGPGGAPAKPVIAGPLKSVGEILFDFGIEEYIVLHPDKNSEEIARDIWEAYGGSQDGVSQSDKLGERGENSSQNPPEVAQKEKEFTEDTKWKRLPAGKSIGDITSIDEIIGLMKSFEYGTIKKFKAPPPAPPGVMPPMASSINKMERTAFVNSLKDELKKLNKYL